MADLLDDGSVIRFRVSPRLHQRVRAAASAQGFSFAEFCRLALDSASTVREAHMQLHVQRVLPEHLAEAVRQLIGENTPA